MSQKLVITLVFACAALQVATMPANVPSTQTIREETTNIFNVQQSEENNERSLSPSDNTTNSNTDKILEQIETINQGLSDPDKQNVASSRRPQTGAEYIIDEGTFDKIQQIVASIKPRPFSQKQQVDNYVNNVDDLSQSLARSKALRFDSSSINNDILPAMPLPYITTMPVMIIPSTPDLFNTKSTLNSLRPTNYLTRQDSSSFPFQFQWPLASFFPILVKDPLLGFLHGGGWNNFFEVGQSADVCSRRQKSHDTNNIESDIFGDSIENRSSDDSPHVTNIKRHARVTRSLKKRNIPTPSPVQNADNGKKSKKVSIKPLLTRTKTKKPQVEQEKEVIENDGDLRFPFSDFTWFGNKKPVAPSPGFFINKMKVRRGGVAIAGPGGVATAGRGGTAIVGPGGLAYTQPGGLAVAGPAARVIALSPYTDLTSLVSRLHQQSLDGSMPRSFNPLSEGRLVATGPVIYYHPASTQYLPFYGGAKGQYLEVQKDTKGFVVSEKIVAEESISSENIVKNNDDSLLTRVLATNLLSLRTLAGSALKLLTLGRRTGALNNNNRARFRTQLTSLSDTASNTVKLIDEIGENIDALFNANMTMLRRYEDDDDDDDVGEEGDDGIGVDAPEHDDDEDEDAALGDARIAEAKPIGLAVIGETGLAAARPVGTAVATSGVALARPVGTAIAGINPALLGIDFQINQLRRSSQPLNKKH